MMAPSLAAAFRSLREVLDLSVDEIAAIGGIAPTYWMRLEDGTASTSEPWVRAAVQRLAEKLN